MGAAQEFGKFTAWPQTTRVSLWVSGPGLERPQDFEFQPGFLSLSLCEAFGMELDENGLRREPMSFSLLA